MAEGGNYSGRYHVEGDGGDETPTSATRTLALLFIHKPLTHALWWSVAPCPTPTPLYLVVVEVAVVAEDHLVRRVLVRVRVRVRLTVTVRVS